MARRSRSRETVVDGVVVVGGGYAGLIAARNAEQRDVAVTIVDPTGRHDHVTRLAAVAGGAASVDDASTELAEFGHAVLIGELATVADGVVTLSDGRSVVADAIVVAAGAVPSLPDIPGLERALTLRTADDALTIRSRVGDSDSVVIIGAGPTGVQLAGAIAHVHRRTSVRIVEHGDRLLSALSSDLGDGAERVLRDRGVAIELGATVDEVTVDGVVVDGAAHDGLVIWAGGFAPNADGLGVPVNDDGRIRVGRDLRIDGMERTFAAGDIAGHTTSSGDPLPMSAQIAVQAGETAGANAARLVAGRPLSDASLAQRGWVLDLSGQRGLAEFGPIRFANPFSDLIPPFLHDVIDLKTRYDLGGLGGLLH